MRSNVLVMLAFALVVVFVGATVQAALLPVTSGLVFRVKADQGVSVSGGNNVTQWNDLTVNANHLTPVVSGYYPTLVSAATPNGSPAIHFVGSADAAVNVQALAHNGTTGLPTGTADRSVFMFGKYNYTAPIPGHSWGGFSYGTNANGQTFGLVVQASDDNLAIQGWGWGMDYISGATGSTWMSQSATFTASGGQRFYHYKDGAQIDTRTPSYNTGTTRIALGVEIDLNGFIAMDVAEALIYNRVLLPDERAQVETYFQNQWVNPIPEPSTLVLLATAGLGLVAYAWRKRKLRSR